MPTGNTPLPLRSVLVGGAAASSDLLRGLLLRHPSVSLLQSVPCLGDITWDSISLIFCDLDEDPSGLLTALCRRPQSVEAIFLASDEKWAAGAFEADALDFLVKPLTGDRLSRTIRRILRLDWSVPSETAQSGMQVFVPFERGRRLIAADEICAIQAIGNYTRVLLAGAGSEIVLRPLRRWEEMLAPGTFLRVHRSTLINARRLRGVEMAENGDGGFASVEGLEERPMISRRCLKIVREILGQNGHTTVHPQLDRRSSLVGRDSIY